MKYLYLLKRNIFRYLMNAGPVHLRGLIIVCFIAACQQKPGSIIKDYQAEITPSELASHVHFIASDVTEGRQTGTAGEKVAAQYLASQYLGMGLLPFGAENKSHGFTPEDYLQEVKLLKREVTESTLAVYINGRKAVSGTFSLNSQNDLAFYSQGALADVKAAVVFGGFGIAADSLSYNDFSALRERGISIDGKWLMILADEPLLNDSVSLLATYDGRPSSFSSGLGLGHKRAAIWQHGRPAGVLIITDSSPRFKSTFAGIARQAATNAAADYRLQLEAADPAKLFPPIYNISTKLADIILGVQKQSVRMLQQQLKEGKSIVFDIPEAVIDTKGEHYSPVKADNVAAYIEGTDTRLKNEFIIVSAHYDHLGKNLQLQGDQVFNGAADDASGTAAVLVLAETFMKANAKGYGPKRSIAFINFTAEEHGKLGSQYYVHNDPLAPLASTIANINMDGIGGTDPNHPTGSSNYIYLAGNGLLSEELLAINARQNGAGTPSLELTPVENRPFSSDHQSFEGALIPYLYYSTGLTSHYHQVSDEPHTLDYEQMANISRLIFATTWQLAHQEKVDRPEPASLKAVYKCPPCPFDCHALDFENPGKCPVCDMQLIAQIEEVMHQ